MTTVEIIEWLLAGMDDTPAGRLGLVTALDGLQTDPQQEQVRAEDEPLWRAIVVLAGSALMPADARADARACARRAVGYEVWRRGHWD